MSVALITGLYLLAITNSKRSTCATRLCEYCSAKPEGAPRSYAYARIESSLSFYAGDETHIKVMEEQVVRIQNNVLKMHLESLKREFQLLKDSIKRINKIASVNGKGER